MFHVGMWADLNGLVEVESDFLVSIWPYEAPFEWPLARTLGLDEFPELTDGHYPEAAHDSK